MCGIYFSCDNLSFRYPSPELQQCLSRRGPDSCDTVTRILQSRSELHHTDRANAQSFLVFSSSVLSLRGPTTVSRQPLIDPVTGSCLCWNGEAWTIGKDRITDADTKAVFEILCKSLDNSRTAAETGEDGRDQGLFRFVRALHEITGPYAFVFFDAIGQRVFFGGDPLGRRSLLYTEENQSMTVSSVIDPEDPSAWNEIEAGDIYLYDLLKHGKFRFRKMPSFPRDSQSFENVYKNKLPDFNRAEPLRPPLDITTTSPSVRDLAIYLRNACQLRAENIPAPSTKSPALAILFSGGVDCTTLARVIHDVVPHEQEIDLLNVAFENPRTIRAAIQSGYILSGECSPFALCPDRQTGLASLKELQQTCPERIWRFVCVNVPFTEMVEHREKVKSLIRPQNTEMDLSIACALYFAARGEGHALDLQCGRDTVYQTPARVLISGLGADELFGGYTRHAIAFERHGYPGLLDELERDIQRIGKRNLGRDDRVIAHWGKEARYPYLDEELLAWSLRLPAWEKCGFGDRQSVAEQEQADQGKLVLEPGKKILRLLAFKMGLRNAAAEKKKGHTVWSAHGQDGDRKHQRHSGDKLSSSGQTVCRPLILALWL